MVINRLRKSVKYGIPKNHCFFQLPVAYCLCATNSVSTVCMIFPGNGHAPYSNTFNIDDKTINTCEKLFY
jgi:hypothetical protein